MIFEIDFNSDEAFYMQLKNQIILAIATRSYLEGEVLPSVRKLSEDIGINMHTVNKAYTVLKDEGFVRVDRRGAVVAVDINKAEDKKLIIDELKIIIARATLKGIKREEMHALIDAIYDEY
ncbi:MAG: GntR family transcriptional regulator [Lachnospiraceae bacterium]|jgi:DNA-binding transcriptional regulator YhcF (GntR family)|nr:GntR family transcriptional regulator [Lachnospiraceae bacterium]